MGDDDDRRLSADSAVSLRQYLESQLAQLAKLMDERDRQYVDRFKAAEGNVTTALAAQEKAVNAAFLASEKAIVKAEDSQKEYNARSNEFRSALDDQAKLQISRVEVSSLMKAHDDKLLFVQTSLENKIETLRQNHEKIFEALVKEIAGLRESRAGGEKTQAVTTQAWGYIIAIGGIVIGVVLRYVR